MKHDDQAAPGETRTADRAEAMLAPGTVLAGRYRIVEIAGAGGMGVVYRAQDVQLDIEVAVKLIGSGRAGDAIVQERFRRELLLSRQVTHPNVVRIHDIGAEGALTFITMDYVPARTLSEVLADGALPAERAIGVARQLASALAATHAEGVVHRDVKPGNVLVAEDGRAWLCDFGIARSLDDETLTREGDMVGTLEYLAPEQVRGERADGRADIYALGLVLWEMLTGRAPGEGREREEMLAQRLSGTLPVAVDAARQIPRGVRRIIRRCLAADSNDRYLDSGQLESDLARGGADLTLTRRVRFAGAAAVLLAAVFAAWTQWPERPATESAAPAASLHRVAVLPLVNGSGVDAYDWIQHGLAEVIAAQLGESAELQVTDPIRVSRTLEDLRLRPESLNAAELRNLGELFAAHYLITGRLLGVDPGLRLELRLIHPVDEQTVRVQDEIEPDALLVGAERLVAELLGHMRVAPPEASAALPLSSDPVALDAFDRGVAGLARGEHARASEDLAQAVAADPEFGMAWLRLADAYRAAGYYEEALDAVERAVALLGETGGRAGAWASARQQELAGNLPRAAAQFQQIIARYPQDIDARIALGELRIDLGELDQARETLAAVTRDDPQHPRAWFLLGKAAIIAGDAAAANDEYLVRALVIQNRLGNAEGRGEVLNALGLANEHLGNLDAARDYYTQAIALREAAGDVRGTSASLSNLARLLMVGGEYAPARAAIDRALAMRREIGDLQGVASLLNDYGVLEEEVGDYGAALAHYREALRLHEEMGGGRGVAGAHSNLAFTYLMLGRFDSAEAFAGRALAAHRETGYDGWVMSTLLIDSELRLARGDWTAAQASLVEAMEIARRLDHPFGRASALGGIATLAWYQGRAGAALDTYRDALEILEPLGDTRGLTEYRMRRAELLLDLELFDALRVELAAADALLGDDGSAAQRARLSLARACADAAGGATAAAAAGLERAAELAAATGSATLALQVEIGRARCLGGGLDAVRELSETAAGIGHRPYRLAALGLLAERQLEAGDAGAASATLRDALRPPLALEPWVGNWRLHALRSRIERESGGDGDAAARRARALAMGIAGSLPDELRRNFLALPAIEALDVVAP